MTTDISIYNSFPSSDELKNLQLIAMTAFKSGLYKGSAEAIIMTLLTARELNVGPMLALNGGVFNINGKVELSARLLGTLIRRSGHIIKVVESTAIKCTLQGIRTDNQDSTETSFTVEEAKKAGLFKIGGGWDKYPEDMCYARALSRLARRLFPDVIGNAYVEGEISGAPKDKPAPESLPEAESEIVEPEATIEPIKLVNGSQSHELLRLKMELKVEDRQSLDKWLKDNLNIDNFDQLPESQFEKILMSLRKKVENEKTTN